MRDAIKLTMGAAAAVAFAALLGWLKGYYYLRGFGIEPALVGGSFTVYLRESWFVVQNLFFLLLLGHIALRTRRRGWWAVWTGYALLPIAAHYAFAFPDLAPARWLILYRHTLLKTIPFLALVAVLVFDRSRRAKLGEWSGPRGRAAAALAVLVVASWAISAAKHFGSFDANRALADPDRFLSRVRVELGDGSELPGDDPYIVAACDERLFLWDGRRQAEEIRILVIARDRVRRLEILGERRVQPGDQYL